MTLKRLEVCIMDPEITKRNYVMETGRIVLDGGPELRDNKHVR